MEHQNKIFNKYTKSNQKIFCYKLNNNQNLPKWTNNNEYVKEDNDEDNDEDYDDDNNEDDYKYKEKNIVNNQNYEQEKPIQILHLNISHLNENNNWIERNKHENFEYIKYLKKTYMDERAIDKYYKQINELEPDKIYKIISETGKIDLKNGIFNPETKYFTSTTQLNQYKIHNGITNMEILVKHKESIQIENIKIRSKTTEINSYVDIEWDLEFCETSHGYKILGLDNFIHLSFVGLNNIFLDIIYKNSKINYTTYAIDFQLKYTGCIYDNIIKHNLEKFLYEDNEHYQRDIIEYLEVQHIFYNNFSYNILRIMSGMGEILYQN